MGRPLTHPARRSEPGGGLIQSYKISSWIVLRLYGAAFLWFSWIIYTGQWPALGLAAVLPFDLSLDRLDLGLALLGVMLVVPMLTPSPLRFPATVLGGAIKAVLLLVLSAALYGLTVLMLADGVLRQSAQLADVLPLFIKAVAGLSVTGAILVSLSTQLSRAEASRDEDPGSLSAQQLQALRRARSGRS